MEELTPLQNYGLMGTFLSLVLTAIYIMFMYIKKIESRTNQQHIKREKALLEQMNIQRVEFEKFIATREDKLIAVITDSNNTHLQNTNTMNNIIKDMAEMFTDTNAKNNEQHLELSNTMRALVLDHMAKNQDLFISVVNKNTEALTNFKKE